MPQCTCTSPDGTESTTYEFDSTPYGASMPCDMACRFWSANHAYSSAYPYGSAKREAKMGSCKMWVKECGSGPDWISLSEPRTQCVAGDKVGAKVTLNHGHGMGQYADISLEVVKASDDIVDVVSQDYGPDIYRYAGVEGPLKTITDPESPFYGQEVRTCMVNGFDSYVYQVARHPSSSVDPIAETAWGEADLSTGPDVGQLAVPLFKFRKYLGRETDPSAGANYGLNPFYDPDAICSVEEFFESTGMTWETIPTLGASLCEGKVRYLFFEGLGSGTNLYKSTSDYEFACRMQMGELLPRRDFNEMYNEYFSKNKMFQEYDEKAVECLEEGVPYDLDAYCALYHWNTANDGGICTGYDVENNPLGSAWWSGTSVFYGGNLDAFNPYYLVWLKDYLVNDLGLTALADSDPMDLQEYHSNTTWSNFLVSEEGMEYGQNKKELTACVITKMYAEYPDQFDWRGAFPPSNTLSGRILLPEEMVGTYDWFDEDDVDYEGLVVLQTNSETANDYGYEEVEMPEGMVRLDYVEVPLEGQDVVAEYRGEVEVSDDINESRETLTDDVREPEGIFLPEDPEVEVIGAEKDLIDSVEQGQLDEEDLKSLFSPESAVQVANMFENVDGTEPTDTSDTTDTSTPTDTSATDDESIFDEGEVDGEPVSDDSFDGMGDPEDDAFESESEDTTIEDSTSATETESEVDTSQGVQESEEIIFNDYPYAPVEAQTGVTNTGVTTTTQTASVAPEKAQDFLKKPIVQAVGVASIVGIVAFLLIKDSK